MLSEGQVQFCIAAAQGDATKARDLLLRIRLIPQIDVLKQPNFEPYPAIIALWMTRQSEPQKAIAQLKQLYPDVAVPKIDGPFSRQALIDLTVEMVFPQVKAGLLPLLHNIALLAGSDDAMASAKQRFYVLACAQSLELILTHPYFNGVGAHKLQITQTVLSKLQPIARQIQSESSKTNLFADIEQEKQLPYAIQHLMSILNGSPSTPVPSTPKLQMQPHRFTDDEVEQALDAASKQRSYFPLLNCRAHAQRLDALASQLTRDNLNRVDVDGRLDEVEDRPRPAYRKSPRPVF
jgi:hypothetical protein